MEGICAETDGLKVTLRETEERLAQSLENLRRSEEQRSRDAEKARETLEATRRTLEEAEVDGTERSRERSLRAAGLQNLLREQGALLAERLVRCWY